MRVAIVVALLLCIQPASAAGATVVAHGNAPDAVIDRDGITHLVWNEARSGGLPDILRYCRIPPGAAACANARSFIPPGRDGWPNTDGTGPKVMVTPFGEVILLTHRWGATVLGRESPNVVYVSDDGGMTFGGAQVLGTIAPDYAPAVFDGADRRVVTVASRGDTGLWVQAAPLGQWTEASAHLSAAAAQDGSVVQIARNSFAVAWRDQNLTVWVRTYTCPLDPCPLGHASVAANWGPPVSVGEAEAPRLTTGPGGTFLMYRSRAKATEHVYFVRKLDGATLGPALPVAQGGREVRDVVEDAGGILHALYGDRHKGLGYRASGDGGVTWGPEQAIVAGEDFTIQSVRVAARTTDAGFVGSAFWESDDGSTLNPPILHAPLPPPDVSLQVIPPGGGGGGGSTPVLPPAPPSACRLLTFAAVDVIADACLTRERDTYVATGSVRVNGLRMELGAGKLRFDTRQRTISSAGATVTVKVGETVLFRSAISWTLPRGSVAALGSVDVSGGGSLFGFPLKGSAEIRLRGGGAEIPVHLGLPALFGGVTGDLTIRADNVAGVHLRDLHVKVGGALIGPLEVKDLRFDYDADAQSWAGAATVALPPQPPGASLAGKIGFSRGELDYLGNELTLPGPGIALDPFAATYLKTIRFELKTGPLRLTGGVTINAGPTIAGAAAIGVDGDLTFTLGDPTILRADGRVRLVGIPLGNAFFELRTNGYVGFGGSLGYEYAGFGATANVDGWLFKSAFNVSAGARICLGDLGCAGGDVVFSSVGFAGCARTPIVDFGAGYRWGGSPELMFSGCDVGPYRATARGAQAGAHAFTFARGVPAGVVAVHGVGAAPHVALVSPTGARIQDTPGTGTRTGVSLVFHNPQTTTTYFVVKAPRVGTWHVEPLPGSPPIAGVQAADGLPRPRVAGSVTRARGRTRVLTYRLSLRPGQQVTFAERGAGVARPIGRPARGRRGQIRFTPADGPGGRRKIVALVSSYGKPRAQITVATYSAPAPAKPAAVRRFRAARSRSALRVTWAPAAGAVRYHVRATLSDGRRIVVRQQRTRLTIPAVARRTRATITVTGLKGDGTRGPSARVRL